MRRASIIIPARNEEVTLPMVLRDLNDTIPKLADVEVDVAGPRDEPERSLIAFAKTVTVYSSEYDRALGFSHEIHRDKRLGLSTKQDLFLASGLVTIDASSIDPAKFYQKFTTATRHSYVFDKAKGVSDLAGIIANVSPQDRTGLVQDARGQKIFWRMR
jgi:hypothetical protein